MTLPPAVFTITACRIFAMGLQQLLRTINLEVLGNVSSMTARIPAASNVDAPVVALVDYAFLGPHLQSREQLRQWLGNTPVLAISPSMTGPTKRTALRVGCHGCLATATDVGHLQKAIAELAGGGHWYERHILFEATQESVAEPTYLNEVDCKQLDSLTGREKTIARCIGLGARNKEIAERLGITEKTVKLHLSRIYGKLGLSNRLQLAVSLTTRSLSADSTKLRSHPRTAHPAST